MSTSLSSLIADVRVLSGLRNNQLYFDSQIAVMISDLYGELYDRIVAAQQHYSITHFDFTLAGGVGGNTVALPERFLLGNGLIMNPDENRPMIVPYAPNWLTRFNTGANVYSTFGWANVPDGRNYVFTGSSLEVYPPNLSQGDYRLFYTPMAERLQAETVSSFDVEADDLGPVNQSGSLAFNFQNMAATEDMIGGTLTLALDSPNDGLNGTYTIADVLSSTLIVTDTSYGAPSWTNPAAGTGTITFQEAGTTDELPTIADPWALYIKLGTSIAIREARQQDVADLERRYNQQAARVSMALQNRQEEATQPPLSRDVTFWDLL